MTTTRIRITKHAVTRIAERILPLIGGDVVVWIEQTIQAGMEQDRFTSARGTCKELKIKVGAHDMRLVCDFRKGEIVVITLVADPFVRYPPDMKQRIRGMKERLRTRR